MTGKRPREMRRTVSISSSLSAGSSDSEISPKFDDSVDQKSTCSVIVPRKVIGFNPRIFPEAAAEIVPSFLAQRNAAAALQSPRSPRPASGLESLFHSPRPDLDKKSVEDAGLMKKDVDAKRIPEDVGLGIVAALHSAADAFHACLMGGCREGELCSASKINDPRMIETQNRAPNSKLSVCMQNQKNPAPDSSKNPLCLKAEGAASNLNRDLGKQSNSRVAQRSDPKQGFGHALIRQASAPNYVMQDESGLAKVDFLEICFLCKHRLRQGRDIYMYRGDKAFCSVECRHQQILNDERAERREKCSAAALEKGSTGQTRHCEHRDRVISATSGTTAAAA